MCGVAGWVSFVEAPRRDVVDAMTGTLRRRGPDAGGLWLGRHAGFGQRRLAVTDAAGGGGPVVARRDGEQVVLTYGGEIYNHQELRTELRGLGHEFHTRGDTEVVLRAYEQWGDRLVDRLVGMYAFAVWDSRARRLLLVRDRLGITPLYYAEVTGGLVFGSEPRALFAHPEITPRIDADGLRQAYGLAFTTGPTAWSGVHEVEPGGLVVLDREGITRRRYWQLAPRPHLDGPDIPAQRVETLLAAAAASQLEADVPLCGVLSGRVDCSVLIAVLADEQNLRNGARIATCAAEHTEPHAGDAARFIGTDHHTVSLDPYDLVDLDRRRELASCRDSPVGADNDISLYLLYSRIRERATVAVSATGAADVFCGYPWFHDPVSVAATTFPWLPSADSAPVPLHPDLAATLRIPEFRADTYHDALAAVPDLGREHLLDYRQRQQQHLTLTRWLPQLLRRTDRLSTAHGLRVRVPYCDHRLVEYAFTLPWSVHTHDGRDLSLLRALGAGIVPNWVRHRPTNRSPGPHHVDYHRSLQQLARQCLDVPEVRTIIDEVPIKTALETPSTGLSLAQRQYLERTVDLALTLDEYRPVLAF
jgi:asparagine synthase (glutamine-hydrolysing)